MSPQDKPGTFQLPLSISVSEQELSTKKILDRRTAKTPQLPCLDPRPNVTEVPFNLTRGVKAIFPLGVTKKAVASQTLVQMSTRRSNVQKWAHSTKSTRPPDFIKPPAWRNVENHYTWCMRVGGSKTEDCALEKNVSRHELPWSKLNTATECSSRNTWGGPQILTQMEFTS